MRLGYARVSRTDQNLQLQTDALLSAGAERIFTDKLSGAKAEREGLAELLNQLREGDTVVVWRLDRLARSLPHLIELAADFERRGVQLVSLTENIDTTTPTGKLVFHLFASIAEFERNLIRERTTAGLEAARARGRKGGRKPALSEEKYLAALKLLLDTGDLASVARTLGVSTRTIRRVAEGAYGRHCA